jgi:ribonuclease HII
MEDLSYEQQAHDAGYALVCGVDEAGAGPLMGPVYAAAVILPPEFDLPGLNDSKKLTEKKREALFPRIQQQALAWSVASVSAREIDDTDILSARMKAMQLAIDGLSLCPDLALIDGNRDHGRYAAVTSPHRCLVGGDGLSASIAAASILAKVSRDHYVTEVLDKKYPQYQFAKHKGYGTKLHYEMLDTFGPCAEHRLSFLRKWEEKGK